MASNYFAAVKMDLDSAADCKGEPSEGYWMARAQVKALLAIAESLDEVANYLRLLRDDARRDWSE